MLPPARLLLVAVVLALTACAGPAPRGAAASGRSASRCLPCHAATQRDAGQRAHAPVREGDCEACHTPHGARGERLFRTSEPARCLGCHDATPFQRAHVHAPARDGCSSCHAPHGSAQPALLARPEAELCAGCHDGLPERHGGWRVDGARCTGCHDPHGAAGERLLGARRHEVLADCGACHAGSGAPAPFALAERPPALCAGCHGEVEEETARKVAHAPAKAGDCLRCHAPHAADGRKLTRPEQPALCLGCHPALASRLRDERVHAPVAQGRCDGCHEPHGSARAGLLVDDAGLCAGCHRDARGWATARSSHAPVRSGDCAGCHEPHAGGPALLARAGDALCAPCHAGVRGARNHPPQACESCHRPHASERAALLARAPEALCVGCHARTLEAHAAERRHTPFAGGACGACHVAHGDREDLLRDAGAKLCLGCHAGVQRTWDRGRSRHAPYVDGRCTACHDAHGSKEPRLLRAASAKVCLSCHAPLAKRLAARGARVHDPLSGGGDCLACHRGHGASEAGLLAAPQEALCGECHDPADAALVKKHRGYALAGTTCTSCHDPHVASSGPLLRAELHPPFADGACTECHYAAPEERTGPAEVRRDLLARCAECHDVQAIRSATPPHAPAARGACFDCHAPHGGSRPHLLREAAPALCLGCHPARAVEAAHGELPADPCAGCHAAHGGGG